MIFYSMLNKGLPWSSSNDGVDPRYSIYLKRETGFPSFEALGIERKEILYKMLDPNPNQRPEAEDLLKLNYFQNIKVCVVDPHNQNAIYEHAHL
jgi:serine/threonine protein kinase